MVLRMIKMALVYRIFHISTIKIALKQSEEEASKVAVCILMTKVWPPMQFKTCGSQRQYFGTSSPVTSKM